jgi:hypothetical protein
MSFTLQQLLYRQLGALLMTVGNLRPILEGKVKGWTGALRLDIFKPVTIDPVGNECPPVGRACLIMRGVNGQFWRRWKKSERISPLKAKLIDSRRSEYLAQSMP